ncbi:zinc finger protein 431-like isoform X1 [Polistes fuscatus]|uniref:zinc finger protein 431-like isoform X1 n=1 Tax=Polistes fuscatus TaxID=30207 RepID=UPI001CA8F6CF|nr:zinc finger protein 431-like isoform X1 [Polistes fuscatus]
MLLCRLCGTYLQDGRLKNIFEDSTDLKQKIIDTLPINISPLDNGSKFICLSCHDKVILYHKFIQEVLRYEKEKLDNEENHCYDLINNEKEQTDIFAKIYSDTVCVCPNCNIDLMILLVSNPQNCDYSFQISLAIVGHSEKIYPMKEQNLQDFDKPVALNIKQDNVNSLNYNKSKAHIMSEESIEIKNNNRKSTLMYNMFGKENSLNRKQKDVKKKLKRNIIYKETLNPVKINKLEVINEQYPELVNDKDTSTLVKLESNDNIPWFNSEDDYNSIINQQNEKIINNEDIIMEDNDNIKSSPKMICNLCGARYFCQSKYEFHMERHKLNCMDKYICIVCKKEACSEDLLWDHYYYTHKSSQRFICLECNKLFSKYMKLKGHQKKYNHLNFQEIHVDTVNNDLDIDNTQEELSEQTQGKTFTNCNLCGKLIFDLDPDAINDLVTCSTCEDSTLSLVVDGNEAKVISPRQYHCSKCPKHFVRKERLEFHEMRHNENMKEFICSTCGKEFSAENSLYEHYLFVHKGARPYICELCGKSFQLKARLREHHRTHTGEKPFQCDVCEQKCTTKNALRLHRKIHFSHNRYVCNICNKSFRKKQNMNEHLEKHWKHDKNILLPKVFTCPICTEGFPTYRMLKFHMIESHQISDQDPILIEQKPLYECEECNEKFKHQMSLKAHKERIHEGKVDPVYQCDICNISYKVKQLLINHIRSKHNGEKRYKCAQCEKGFNDTKSLYNHVLLHTGKKPFVCEYCNMRFRRKDSRDHHQRKHTGELPYQCQDCGENFATYNYRSKHRKQHHGKGDLECPECGEKCNDQQEIRIHLNNHLGEKLKQLENV